MSEPDKQKITDFLLDVQSVSPVQFEIIEAVQHLFHQAHADISEEIKYGGLVFILSGSLLGGMFAYKNHLSLEFSQGAEFSDPSGLLEGKGKYRRHLKLLARQDIQHKEVAAFIQQAVTV